MLYLHVVLSLLPEALFCTNVAQHIQAALCRCVNVRMYVEVVFCTMHFFLKTVSVSCVTKQTCCTSK